jgi:mono/diheme cytochrome c family protein
MKRRFVHLLAGLGIALLAAVAATAWLATQGDGPPPRTGPAPHTWAPDHPQRLALAARGAELARLGNCYGCHSDRGAPPWTGGRRFGTPFGDVYTSNLTPDPDTGLGRWNADDFWRALHLGRSRDGRFLLPVFPFTNTTLASVNDSDALWAYFQSLPAQHRTPKPQQLHWPYNTTAAQAIWRALYFTPSPATADEPVLDTAQTPQWNRGAYLVRGLAHCSACHAPRDDWGGLDDPFSLAGGILPGQAWYAPSLTEPRQASVAHWPRSAVLQLLRTGRNEHATLSGPMAEVARHSTQYINDADLNAMVTYLQALPDQATPAPASEAGTGSPGFSARALRGQRLYSDHCASCHGDQGVGQPGAYPALAGNRSVILDNTHNLVQTVLYGGFGPVTHGNPRPFGMPPYVLTLSNRDVADVLSYLRQAWGNAAPDVTELTVQQVREAQR